MAITAPPERFETLDALRGIAAIAVMLFHAGWQAPILMPRGYLGADLFFVLSGFVLAHAYGQRLAHGMPLHQFLLARLKRIYPLYWLGALTGCALFAGSPLMLLMLPSASASDLLFNANAPLWSVVFELAVNCLWALAAARLGWRGLIAALVLSGGILTHAVLTQGNADLGAHWHSAGAGLARTTFSFTIGLMLYRLHRPGKPQRQAAGAEWLIPAAALPLLLGAPISGPGADLATIGLVLPALVWWASRCRLPAPGLARWLGAISFPLYCLHAPFVAMSHGSVQLMTATCLAMIALASLLARWFDRPIQAALKRGGNTAMLASPARL